MFHATERLPHLLLPDAYSSNAQFDWEISHVFSNSWHFVGLKSELSRPGDFITTEVCGLPVQVRNVAGTIHAVSNICAHRHCLLTSKRKGSSPKLSCQYHGWEYSPTGASQRIPMAQHFAPLDQTSVKIPVYRVASIGALIFVNLNSVAPDLKSFLGNSVESVGQGFDDRWEAVMSREFHHAVNWKIPIENTLEAYHVPAIHPETFRADPGEERTEHTLGESGTSMRTTLPFAPHSNLDAWFQRIEGRILGGLIGDSPTAVYQQHHVFPNVLFSFTDMVSLLHVVRPTGPQTCTSVVHQFGRTGKSVLARQASRLWGRLAAGVTLKILKEDFQLYPDIQRGLNSSQSPGMLGRCEERIHRFQRWIQNRPEENVSHDPRTKICGVESELSCGCSADETTDRLEEKSDQR